MADIRVTVEQVPGFQVLMPDVAAYPVTVAPASLSPAISVAVAQQGPPGPQGDPYLSEAAQAATEAARDDAEAYAASALADRIQTGLDVAATAFVVQAATEQAGLASDSAQDAAEQAGVATQKAAEASDSAADAASYFTQMVEDAVVFAVALG